MGVVLTRVIYNLFFSLYFLVIAFLPLSHLHVENTGEMSAIVLSGRSIDAVRFIDFVHEVFFSHMGQTIDQAPSAPIKTCKGPVGSAKLSCAKSFPLSPAQTHERLDSLRIPNTSSIRQGDSSGHVQGKHQGFAPCFSGLSPPSVPAA